MHVLAHISYARIVTHRLRQRRQRVQRKWDRARADIAYRWEWLRGRMKLVSRGLQQCEAALSHFRNAKTAPYVEMDANGPIVMPPRPASSAVPSPSAAAVPSSAGFLVRIRSV